MKFPIQNRDEKLIEVRLAEAILTLKAKKGLFLEPLFFNGFYDTEERTIGL